MLVMEFKTFETKDYEALCDFLIELNKDDNSRINWNWARFEWMYEHPYTNKEQLSSIGLWKDDNKIVAATLFDMYFGEGYCACLPKHMDLLPEVIEHAYKSLSDDEGFRLSICDDNFIEIETATKLGFDKVDQYETIMSLSLEKELPISLPSGFHFKDVDQDEDVREIQWLFWQGFDHGNDREEFEREEEPSTSHRPHFNKRLSVGVVDANNELVTLVGVWFINKTNYAYVEPVCTIPRCRKKGLAKAAIYEALNRARELGAKKAYVLSDMDFYANLGFKKERHYTFYQRRPLGK